MSETTETGFTNVTVRLPGAKRLYTYLVRGPVKPGDRVMVPGPPWNPGTEQAGTVERLGGEYGGTLREARVVR